VQIPDQRRREAIRPSTFLESPNLRDGIKSISNWPTISAAYVKGEFVGGCDISARCSQAGELQQVIVDKGVAVSAAASCLILARRRSAAMERCGIRQEVRARARWTAPSTPPAPAATCSQRSRSRSNAERRDVGRR